MSQPAFTPISELGEFGLIGRIQSVLGEPADDALVKGIGDDAAVYRIADGRYHVVTTDLLVEGVHFDRMFAPMEALGFKAMAVNVSDVCAMNARPRYATVGLGLPNSISVEMVEQLYIGFRNACTAYGLTLAGGDVSAAQKLTLSVTVIGETARPVYRSGARAGDFLCVTGELGAAYAGLKTLLWEKENFQRLDAGFQPDLAPYADVVRRQLRPEARFDVIGHWAELGLAPNALIDVSDGLASEVHHLCRQSTTGALIQGHTLPIALSTRSTADRFAEDVDAYALFGGEDYELLFAVNQAQLAHLEKADADFVVIGRFTPPDEGIRIETPDGDLVAIEPAGYAHF